MKNQMHYVLVGYPFSGKTVLARELEKRLGFVRLNIDEVKFEFGYENVSDDDVPEEEWKKIFEELDKRIIDSLKKGKTVVNEYAWINKKWRDRARKLADKVGVETIFIFVNTPKEVVIERWKRNKITKERFDIPEDLFKETIEIFEPPSNDENYIFYENSMDLDKWIETYIR